MRNFVSLRYVHDNAPSIWKYMTEHNCILKKFGSTIYEGVLDEGKYLKYLSDDDSPSITVECYVNPDSTVPIFTVLYVVVSIKNCALPTNPAAMASS